MKQCPFPEKKKYTKAEARQQADYLFATKGWKVVHYVCKSGGHSHIGHKSPFSLPRKRSR